MAITIRQNVATYAPAYNPLVYVVTSNNVAQPNFRFVADIYISGVSSPAYFRIKKAPHPTFNTGIFDIHRILENYVTHVIGSRIYDVNTFYPFQQCDADHRQYQVKFGEEYGVSSALVVYPNLTLGTSGEVFNAAMDYVSRVSYTSNDWDLKGSDDKFLTNNRSTRIIGASERHWLYMFGTDVNNMYYARVLNYTSSDGTTGQVGTYYILNDYRALATTADRFVRFEAGTKNLALIDDDFYLAGYDPSTYGNPITSTINSYKITMVNGSLSPVSESVLYTIDRGCFKYDTYRIHFLNEMGGFDSFTFKGIAVETTNISRTGFKKTVGTATATTFAYAISDKEKQELNVNYEDTLVMESDWISEANATWLEDLLTSPVVYLDDGTNLIGLNITSVSNRKKKVEVDVLINLRVEAKYSFDNSKQRG